MVGLMVGFMMGFIVARIEVRRSPLLGAGGWG